MKNKDKLKRFTNEVTKLSRDLFMITDDLETLADSEIINKKYKYIFLGLAGELRKKYKSVDSEIKLFEGYGEGLK